MRVVFSFLFLLQASHLTAAQDPTDAAETLRMHGDYSQAEAILRVALTQNQTDSVKAVLLTQLGDLLREQDRSAEARAFFEDAMRIQQKVPWEARFSAIVGLADIDRQCQSWDSSIQLWNEGRSLAEGHGSSLLAALAMRGLGETWMDRGNFARAEPLLKKAVSQLENDPGAPQFRIATALDSLASLYRMENKTGMAEDLWTRELQIDRKQMGENHPQTALVMGHLAEVWAADGDYERASSYSRQVMAIMESHFQRESTPVASALVNDGVIEQHAHNYEAAADRYSEALAILRTASTEPDAEERTVMQLYSAVKSHVTRPGANKQNDVGSDLKQRNGFIRNK